MNLSLGATSGMVLNWILSLSTSAEKGGAYGLWIGEDIDRGNDIFTSTGLCLMETSTVKVGIGITSPLIRNISTISRAAASLAELGRSRFRLGLGVGGLQDLAKKKIAPEKPVSIINEAVSLLRRIWSGETMFTTGRFQLDQYAFRFKVDVPIYLGARGENMLKIAGKIADGVIISSPVRYVEKAVSLVKEGWKMRERESEDFQIVVWLPCILTRSKDEVTLAKETAAVVIADTPRKVLEAANIDIAKALEVTSAVSKMGVKKAAGTLTDSLVGDFCVYGSAEQICSTMRYFENMGIDEFVLGPPYGMNPQSAVAEMLKVWRGQC